MGAEDFLKLLKVSLIWAVQFLLSERHSKTTTPPGPVGEVAESISSAAHFYFHAAAVLSEPHALDADGLIRRS